MTQPFNPANPRQLREQLAVIRADRALGRRRRFARSKLDRYRAEIEALAAQGASWRDITAWLRRFKRTKVSASTVGRRLQLWREWAQHASRSEQASAPGSGPETKTLRS